MQRRNFIRVLGGGAVAAAVGTGGCSADYPAAAVRPWQGPADSDDPRRWALAYAILAPNSHNRQPWRVDLSEPNAIVLLVDRQRTLPATDPWYRQIVVSQGTFVEALVIALRERGIDPTVQLFPEGEFAAREIDDRPVARIHWAAPAAAAAATPDALFTQLLSRHTAKVDYDTTRNVSVETLAALAGAAADPSVRFGSTVDAARVQTLRQLCLDAARVEVLTPDTALESLRLTRVGPDEIDRHRDGISLNGWLPRLAVAVGAFDRGSAPTEGSTAYEQTMALYEGHCGTAMGFLWLSTPTSENAASGRLRSAEVNAGRAFMRVQLMATQLGLQVHPLSQAPQEFPAMQPHYERMHQLLVGRPAGEETVQMLCRVGYCAPQPHTPRRGVDAIIRA
jgi:nitroreductase